MKGGFMQTNIIKFYDGIDRQKFENDIDVKEYRESLSDEITSLTNLQISTSNLERLLHPIKTVRSNKELRILTKTRKRFNKLISSSLSEYINIDSEDLESDLTEALVYSKPERVSSFMKQNPVKKLTLNKK